MGGPNGQGKKAPFRSQRKSLLGPGGLENDPEYPQRKGQGQGSTRFCLVSTRCWRTGDSIWDHKAQGLGPGASLASCYSQAGQGKIHGAPGKVM